MIAASFSMGASGRAQIFEMSVMPVTREWLPYEGLEERSLVTHAVEDQRHFVKGMRVNLGLEMPRSEEHTSELQSLMRISYAVFCSKKKTDSTPIQKGCSHPSNTVCLQID